LLFLLKGMLHKNPTNRISVLSRLITVVTKLMFLYKLPTY